MRPIGAELYPGAERQEPPVARLCRLRSEVLERNAIEDVVPRRQATQIDAGREVAAGERGWPDDAPSVLERLAVGPLDREARRSVTAAPDDRSTRRDVTALHAVRDIRTRGVRGDDGRPRLREEPSRTEEIHGRERRG